MTPDKRQVSRQFSRAASQYDQYATLQQQMAERLMTGLPAEERLCLIDLGCGTGHTLSRIAHRRPSWDLIGVDLATGMIEQARAVQPEIARWECCDLESTPFPAGSVDVVFSNAAIQWCDPKITLREMSRLLKPTGRVLVSTFGPNTLRELREAFQKMDPEDQPVHNLPAVPALRQAFLDAGLERVSIVTETVTQSFGDIGEMLNSVRRVGATYAGHSRPRGMAGRERLRQLHACLRQGAQREGRYRLTYECLFASADAVR